MPYKDINKRRECSREWARKDRKNNPDKHKKSVKKWRNENYEMFLEQKRRFYRNHKDDILSKYKTSYQKLKFDVFSYYSKGEPKCSCCGEKTYEFLTIEHLNGGGTKHRKEIGASNVLRYIKKNNYPEEFDVLCYNCNCSKSFNKICPHKLM